ncbi:MAG: hypothetical protein KDC24_13730, partial [Saprospiraceae bacterium]|nr:hypothetical protein [Saprospiraceae bacterium]
MRNLISLLVILFIGSFWACQPSGDENQKSAEMVDSTESAEATVEFDSALAAEYGADQYGMKKYVIAFLKRGPNRDRDSAESAALQRAHLLNIERMAEEGTLVLAGPFFGNDDLRGIYVFDVPS